MLIHSFSSWFHSSPLPICPFLQVSSFQLFRQKKNNCRLTLFLNTFSAALHCMWDFSSPSRHHTCAPALRVWSLNHWTAREVRLIFDPSTSFTLYIHLHCHHPSLSHHHLLPILPKRPPNGLPAFILDHSIVKWLLKVKLVLVLWFVFFVIYNHSSEIMTHILNNTTSGLPLDLETNLKLSQCLLSFYKILSLSASPTLPQITPLISIIYLQLCNKLPQTYWLKTTNIYYLTVSVEQEFRTGLASCFWLRISHEVADKKLARPVAPVDSRIGVQGSNSKMSHLNGCWQKVSGSYHVGFSIRLVKVLTRWYYGWFSEVTHCQSAIICFLAVCP